MFNYIKIAKTGSNKGLTLIELMVVIGIMSIISAIAIPYMFNSEQKLKKAVRDLMGDMQNTRAMAIKTGKPWGIWFDVNNNRYVISSDNGDGTWSNSDTDASQVVEKTVYFAGYTAGIQYGHGAATTDATFDGGTFPVDDVSYSSNVLTFDSKGRCSIARQGYGNQFVYLEYGEHTFAVGTGSTGIVRTVYWDGSKWQ